MIDIPNEICKQCNWWSLLDEIKGVFEMELINKKQIKVDYEKGSRILLVGPIMELFNHSAFKVCKGHIKGKR